MALHVLFSARWLAVVFAFLRRRRGCWRWVLTFAVSSFWFLPVGLGLGLIQVVLLLGSGRVREYTTRDSNG
jgi:hypothetical protein